MFKLSVTQHLNRVMIYSYYKGILKDMTKQNIKEENEGRIKIPSSLDLTAEEIINSIDLSIEEQTDNNITKCLRCLK